MEQEQAKARLEIRKRKTAALERRRGIIESWKADFVGFAKKLDVINKDGERIKVQQSPILRAFEVERTGRDYVLKPRQVFMTTWELARDIWFWITRPGARVTILCQSDKDNKAVKEISDRIRVMLGMDEAARTAPDRKLGLLGQHPEFKGVNGIIEHSQTRWTFGDSVLTIMGAGATEKSAGKKGRAGTIHRLHVTEVAFFEYADDTLTAILECVPPRSANNEIVFESTPKGAAGFFYEKYNIAKTGANGYRAHFFQWFKQPEYREALEPEEIIEPNTERERELVQLHGVAPEQLKWYRQKVADKGAAKVDQEYPTDEQTCWLFDGRIFFDREALSRLRLGARPPVEQKLAGALKIWHKPQPDKTYVIAADPSNGVGGDPVAAIVLERGSGRHCATLHGQFVPDTFALHLAALGFWYNYALIVVERSSSVQAVHDALSKWERPGNSGIGYPHIYSAGDKHLGFKMTSVSRPAVLDALEVAIRTKSFETYDAGIIEEAQLFIVVDEKPQAAPGAHDDRIMALAIAWDAVRVPMGLKHTDFGLAPSIHFEKTPVAFEGANTGPDIDKIVDAEKRKWAGADVPVIGGWGFAGRGGSDFDGF